MSGSAEDPGVLHNQALAFVYDKLIDKEQSQSTGQLTHTQVKQVIDEALHEFFAAAGLDSVTLQSIPQQTAAWWTYAATDGDFSIQAMQVADAHVFPVQTYSNTAIGYLEAIADALETHGGSQGQLNAVLDSIGQQARTSLSGAELAGVLGMSSVARYSAEYWSAHGAEWEAFCSRNPGACPPDGMVGQLSSGNCGLWVLLADSVGFALGSILLAAILSTAVFLCCMLM